MRPKFSTEDHRSEDDFSEDVTSSEDEISSISFGALNKAQQALRDEEASDSAKRIDRRFTKPTARHQKKSKHAPTESSSKKPVKKIREIPGLESERTAQGLYRDIRFDPAYGKADLAVARKNYKFLDEYRERELGEMKSLLADKKSERLLSQRDRQDLNYKIQSLQSRLDTMRNRDLSDKILADHKRAHRQRFDSGEAKNPYFLKKSDKRKLIQKAKFDSMKSKQREKVIERKRKRRLGKEMKQLEFN